MPHISALFHIYLYVPLRNAFRSTFIRSLGLLLLPDVPAVTNTSDSQVLGPTSLFSHLFVHP